MCGIIGIIGKQDVAPLLIEGLRRLEYRGYDSAGVATLVDGTIERRRAEGKLDNLDARLARAPLGGHDRHRPYALGDPWRARRRTTPIRIATDRVAVVHNGIIENFQELKAELTAWRPSLRERRPTPRSWRIW